MGNRTEGYVLLIDIGNSSLKWAMTIIGSESNSKMGSESNLLLKSKFDSDPFIPDSIIQCWKNLKKPTNIIVSCVAQEHVWRALQSACDNLWNMKIQKVESLSEGYGLVNAYAKASDLGSDRWCAMIGASQIADSAFIVVDAGSAITIDKVDESGQHLGGYITPGLRLMKKSLGLHAAQVNVDLAHAPKPTLSLARSTTACVDAGIYLSAISLIEAVFEKESKQFKTLQCFLTGGDAEAIAKLLSFKCVIMPDMVLRGLAEIQKRDQE